MRTFLIAGALLAGTATVAVAHDVQHLDHSHAHGSDCGHTALAHDGHVDYLHNGHLHHMHDGHVHEHVLAVTAANPADHALAGRVEGHGEHLHTADEADHPRVQHGDHFDFIHNGTLHHVHGDHVDDHGPVTLVRAGS